MSNKNFIRGIKSGIPICLGYLSVSFTFGIMAVSLGFTIWQSVLVSMLCVTSAGQYAGIQIMTNPGHYIEMLISQFTINVRYSFMSISLSQKVSKKFSGIWRWIFGAFVTDEIFGVAISEEEITRSFFAGLCIMPYIGWTSGTLLGSILGSILPNRLMSALSIAIYGMFVAIVVPELKKGYSYVFVVIIAAIFSTLFKFLPLLNKVPGGIAISICAIIASLLGAIFFPISDDENASTN
ncbi:Predicted branched-chain amino acid permease (azaleucine resistance) [Eubacterium uniforme]|uniref:Predicted branched-chain amino acid permease (Azaleucine resistance) n=1 Tax=Eubacterium uniforme TaxID=39495 RepID=A0A1T4W4W3_9FIRM|nr:AzlC family ABC transporter permease [Eubacterium uniforme]SKA72098.1 Predicted branched-chain amino acid permease (azaleucine resistance) [Eubacterium uniforme]